MAAAPPDDRRLEPGLRYLLVTAMTAVGVLHFATPQPFVELTEYGFRAPDGFKDVEEAKSFYRDVAESFGELAAEGAETRFDLDHFVGALGPADAVER